MPALASLLCGFIFGAGLVISHMVQTTKVLGFLDVFGIANGTWDPSLIVVMAAGLLVTGIGFALIRPRTPIFAPKGLWPAATDIDRPLHHRRGAVRHRLGFGGLVSGAGDCRPGDAVARRVRLCRRHGGRHGGARSVASAERTAHRTKTRDRHRRLIHA